MARATEDRRIRRTRRAIHDAFLRLMENEPASQVGITELCREADIHRSTFYDHYSAPKDVLAEIEDQFLGEMSAMLDEGGCSGEVTSLMLKHLNDNRQQWRALWNGDPDLIARALDLCCERTLDAWGKNDVEASGENALFLQFITRGASGVVGSWLEDGCTLSPDELSETINRFVFKGQGGVQQ